MKFDLETMDLEIVKRNYPKEYAEERDDDNEYLFTNGQYNRVKSDIMYCEKRNKKTGLYNAQAYYLDEDSYDDPMRYDFPENVLLSFSFQLTHLLHQEAFTRHQNLLLTSLYEDLKANIAWFYRHPNLIVLSEDIKPYLYRLLEEMENRLSERIILWPCKSPEESKLYDQDIAWAYEPDEEINPEPWAQKDLGEKQEVKNDEPWILEKPEE